MAGPLELDPGLNALIGMSHLVDGRQRLDAAPY